MNQRSSDPGKLPPQDLAAERATLGSQLLNPEMVDPVSTIIDVGDYYSDIHQMIQKAINNLFRGGKDIDPMTVGHELERMGKFAEIGGAGYLIEIFETVHHGAHAEHYAAIVAELSRRRKAIQIGHDLIRKAHDRTETEYQLFESIFKGMESITDLMTGINRHKPKLLADEVHKFIEGYAKGKTPSVFWGISEIDSLIGGTVPGEMIIIAGRTSMGKSLVMQQWIDTASQFVTPFVISLEMESEQYAGRSLAYLSEFPETQWKSEIETLKAEADRHFEHRHPILISEHCETIADVEREVARAVKSHDVKLVALDYAQLCKGEGYTREQQVGDVSTRMKRLAKKHKIVVLLLAQMNRDIEKRDNPTPRLSDLAQSGSLENDADVVLFPFWPWKHDPSYKPENEYRVYQCKNRSRGLKESVCVMEIRPNRQCIVPADHQQDFYDRFE